MTELVPPTATAAMNRREKNEWKKTMPKRVTSTLEMSQRKRIEGGREGGLERYVIMLIRKRITKREKKITALERRTGAAM